MQSTMASNHGHYSLIESVQHEYWYLAIETALNFSSYNVHFHTLKKRNGKNKRKEGKRMKRGRVNETRKQIKEGKRPEIGGGGINTHLQSMDEGFAEF
jgi:hypothetical protein